MRNGWPRNYQRTRSSKNYPWDNVRILIHWLQRQPVTAEDLMGIIPTISSPQSANLVVSTDNNLNAVVQYAVEHKVKHIIVCGHYGILGGVNDHEPQRHRTVSNSWLQTLRDVIAFIERNWIVSRTCRNVLTAW